MASAGLLHLQIDVDPRDQGIKKLIHGGQYRPISNNGQSLDPMETISDVWPGQPPNRHLHVFVSLPARVSSPAIRYDGGECFIRLFAPAQNI